MKDNMFYIAGTFIAFILIINPYFGWFQLDGNYALSVMGFQTGVLLWLVNKITDLDQKIK